MKFFLFRCAIPEDRKDEFRKMMEDKKFRYEESSFYVITNLKAWQDEKQNKF